MTPRIRLPLTGRAAVDWLFAVLLLLFIATFAVDLYRTIWPSPVPASCTVIYVSGAHASTRTCAGGSNGG